MPYADKAAARARGREYRREIGLDREREKQRRWREENPLRWREIKYNAKARAKGAFVENVDLAKLWERDEGICGICYEPADPEWELDHIIPYARGGKHETSNAQVSHPLCNRKKGAS